MLQVVRNPIIRPALFTPAVDRPQLRLAAALVGGRYFLARRLLPDKKGSQFGSLFRVDRSNAQTTAPSSLAPSMTFFGLMNCSRETPSHMTSGLATSTEE